MIKKFVKENLKEIRKIEEEFKKICLEIEKMEIENKIIIDKLNSEVENG